jgi:glutathione S-transferase
MLTVWGRKTSSNVQALMWCIGELGLRFSRHDIGHKYGGQDTPEFLAMNPNGTVPVLKDGDGEPLWETGAILRYLSNRYGGAPFSPQGLEDRTHVDKWAEWSKINIALNFTAPIFWRVVRTAPERRGRDRRGRWCPRQQARHRRAPGLAPRLSRRGRFHARRHPVRPPALSLFRHRNRSPQPSGPATLLRQADRAAGLPAACDGVV